MSDYKKRAIDAAREREAEELGYDVPVDECQTFGDIYRQGTRPSAVTATSINPPVDGFAPIKFRNGPGHVGLAVGDTVVTSTSIEATLEQRGQRYGDFAEHARITQAIKAAMADSPNWARLAPDQREALEMIAHKAGRILNGDPDYHDSWHDIVGYTKLVADLLAPEVAS